MATAYTPILKLALPVTGELNGTWGDVVNQNITEMVEQAVAGLATINTWTTNSHTLTTANGTTSESRCAMLVIDDDGAGNPSAAATVICPTATKAYIVRNLCGQTVTVKTAAGTGVAVPNNQAALVFCDGTNVVTGAFNGDVVGPATATNNAIVTFDGTTGKLIKDNSGATISAGVITATGFSGPLNGSVGASTPSTVVATQVDITAQGDLRLQDTTGGEFVALQAPGTLATSYTLTLPVDDGTSGQALITDGSGVLSWSTAASGDVYGPASATDNAVARYDGTTGKIIQNSTVTIADTTGNMTGVGTLGVGAITTTGALTYGGVTLSNSVTGTGSMVLSTSPTLVTPALGTPTALVGTNITGTASGLTAGNVTTNANLTGAITSTGNATVLGSFSSANLAGALTDETGTGSAVFATSPTLVTPALGTPASGVVTNLTGTASININGTVGATTPNTGAFTTLSSTGNTTLGDATADLITANARFNTDLVPSTDNARDLGTAALKWKQVFATTFTENGSEIVVQTDIGTAPNEIPLNQYLGNLAFQDAANIAGSVTAGSINNTPIGSTTASTGAFTTLTSTSDATINGVKVGRGGGSVATNTAVGTNAINATATGTSNTAVGTTALRDVTSGISNTALGASALIQSTTGDYNTAIGTQAMFANTSGGSSVAIGFQSLYFNTTGTFNNAFGRSALNANTTGANNIGIGSSALQAITTTSNNTAVGYSAGSLITTGAKNTLLGCYNGNQGGLDIRTTSNNIVLSDGDGNPRIIANSVGDVGIGTVAPNASAILDVQSTTKGVRMPNMTTVQKNAIVTPAAGLMVFDTTLSKLCVYTGAAWETITSI